MTASRQKYILLYKQQISKKGMNKDICEEIFELDIPQSFKGKEWSQFILFVETYYTISAIEVFLIAFSIDKIIEKFQTKHIIKWNELQEIFRDIETSQYIKKAIVSTPKDFNDIMKPEYISEELVNSIEEYINEKELFKEELTSINEEKAQLNKLKEKVLSQLKFINTILEDPSSIERIEDYEDIFSKGNYENLKKICEYLKTSVKMNEI